MVQAISDARNLPAEASIKNWLNHVFDEDQSGEVTVRIVDEDESQQLNHHYRGKNYATNVLAFAYDADHEVILDALPVGDIVICAGIVEREALDQGKTIEAHWAHLVVHGGLHLRGFDHETEAEATEMESRERMILAELGIGNPYEALAHDDIGLQDNQSS